MSYNFTDPEIFNMVTIEHQPTEAGFAAAHRVAGVAFTSGYEFGSEPRCKTCKETWPCVPIKALREFQTERQRAHHARMAEEAPGSFQGMW